MVPGRNKKKMRISLIKLEFFRSGIFLHNQGMKNFIKAGKVCVIQLDHICFEKSLSTFWQVRCCMHRTRRSLSKVGRRFFSNFVAFSENPNFSLMPGSAQKAFWASVCLQHSWPFLEVVTAIPVITIKPWISEEIFL